MLISARETGAAGDGRTDDSAAIAKAIAKLKENGGGTLLFEPGTYLSGTQKLCSNIELHLAKGAILKALPEISAYEKDTAVPAASLKYYFLHLDHVKNVTISGEGTIDGSGPAFWKREYLDPTVPPLKDGEEPPDEIPDHLWQYYVLAPKQERIVTIYASGCSGLTLKDFSIRDAAAYTVWLIGSEKIVINNINVHNRRSGPNTDILDIDCCRNVRISKCRLAAGDDCIALKSDSSRTGTDFICEDIVVSDCDLTSATCGIRLGYEGDAPIRDCRFENLTIHDTRTAIDMLSLNTPCPYAKLDSGTQIERISFQDITMKHIGRAFFLWAGCQLPEKEYKGYIRDLTFSGIEAEGCATSWIGTGIQGAIRNISMKNVSLKIAEDLDIEPEADPLAVPNIWQGQRRAGALVLRGIEGLKTKGLQCRITNSETPALRWKNTTQFHLNGEEQTPDGTLQKV
ncbi:MAG: right-handed parallel beta-helix repeat-containing protein [Lentisphaeria bacterium]|nr:right-handed parallel beta-helix repeat-containing protein [Lentisphaeria bacterium]